MAYATQQNCSDRFGEDTVIVATDRENTGAIDTDILGKALTDADATINSYIAGLPGFPFDPAPDILELLACDIAIYLAARPAGVATETDRQRYEDAIKYLEKVEAQKIRLPYDDGEAFVAPNSTATIVQSERVFTRTKLGNLF